MEHGMYVSKQQALCHVKKTKKKKTYPSLQTKNVQVLFEVESVWLTHVVVPDVYVVALAVMYWGGHQEGLYFYCMTTY